MQVPAIFPVHPAVAELLTAQSQKIVAQMEEIDRLRQTIATNEAGIKRLGCENFALGAEKEYAEIDLKGATDRIAMLERQLAAADAENLELRAALAVAKLPATSRDNVIQLVREAAA